MNLEKYSTPQAMNKGLKRYVAYRKQHISPRTKIALWVTLVAIIIFANTVKEWIDRRDTMNEMREPIIVGFPLRGEWLSPNTPGTKIPSHGTNQLGTRYAYDFIQVDWNRTGYPAYRVSLLQYYAALCHLQTGSVQVSVGQKVTKGEIVGNIGHSGNSFAPHLHFQLMDSSNIATANGLPCAFEEYELFKNGTWEKVTNGIPTSKDRIRF